MNKAFDFSNKCVGYLSGAPRVSTFPDAEESGPQSHVLGTINAFESLGWKVIPFIAGDFAPRKWVRPGSKASLSQNRISRLLADCVRFLFGIFASRLAWHKLKGKVSFVYERLSLFQSLGRIFKRHGVGWILESNAPLFYEGKFDRKTTMLYGLARRIEIQAYRECDILVCVSDTLKQIVVKEAGISPEKILVVPNGVDTDFFDPEKHGTKSFFSNFTVGFVGNLAAWQGLDLLLEALSELSADGLKFSLTVVGDGSDRAALEKLAEKIGISGRTTFVGQVARHDVPCYISGFDVGYCGQISAKFGKVYFSPLKLYEYMAMAKPVIASACEDAQHVIKENETGFLFQSGDKEDLKRALAQAYHSRARLLEMGLSARREIVSSHSWTSRVRKMINQLEDRQGA